MRILIFSLQVTQAGSRGHLHPWLGVVQRLTRAGHEVLWCPVPAAMGAADAACVTAAGATVVQPPPTAWAPPSEQQLGLWALERDQIWRCYRSFLLEPAAALVEPLRRLLEELRPDRVAMDGMCYCAALACGERPYLAVCAGLKLLHRGPFEEAYRGDFAPLLEEREELFRGTGRFRLFELWSPHGNVVFTVPSLDPDGPEEGLHCVGPSLPLEERGDEPADFPWERLPATFAYASFGSVHSQIPLPQVIPALVEACRRLNLFLVLASAHYQDLGDGVLTVPYAPQLELLRRCSHYVSHGGANSFTEALAHGVPQLVVPLSSDQPLQVRLIERAGAGTGVLPGAGVEAFEAALRALPQKRPRAQEVAAEMRAHDGAQAAAELILRCTPGN